MQFSLAPYSGAMTFFTNFYRIAAYNKQIRCLAYAQGSTLEVRWAILVYSARGPWAATGAVAPPSGWPALWAQGLHASAPAAPAGGAGHHSSRRPPRQTEGILEGPAVPDQPSERAFLSRWGCAALLFPSTYGKCVCIHYRVHMIFSNVYFVF